MRERVADGIKSGVAGGKARFDACVAILAAGASRRMGSPKQLAAFDGASLVRRACLQAIAACPRNVCVVTGAYAPRVAAEVADLGVDLVENDEWGTGQASSVRAAVRHCTESDLSFLGVLPVDMPLVDAAHLEMLLRAAQDAGIDAAASSGPEGPMAPCVFSRRVFPALDDLEGDRGALRIISDPSFASRLRLVKFADAAMAADVDTPDDLRRIEKLACKARKACRAGFVEETEGICLC